MIKARLEAWYLKFWSWMRGSGTILWARLCVIVNVVLVGALATDISNLTWIKSHPDVLVWWNIANGIITEFIRRNNTDIETTSVHVANYGNFETQKIVPKDPS